MHVGWILLAVVCLPLPVVASHRYLDPPVPLYWPWTSFSFSLRLSILYIVETALGNLSGGRV
jgi:hypothetical protein